MIYRFIVITEKENLLIQVKSMSYHLALQDVISMYPNCEIFTSINKL